MRSSKGTTDWSGDRIQRMVRTKNLESEQNALVLLKDFPTPERVGDFGSGIGRRHLYFPNSEYTGFDREEIMVETAGREFPQLDIRLTDITKVDEKYPEAIGSFDMILTFAVVQYNYLEEQKAIYECIYRCLKPGGLYYWRENKNNASLPDAVLPELFEQAAYDGADQRVYRKK